jgi:hypothetical protein
LSSYYVPTTFHLLSCFNPHRLPWENRDAEEVSDSSKIMQPRKKHIVLTPCWAASKSNNFCPITVFAT